MFYSVVIPVYNRADTIIDVLLSVKSQDFQDYECIIVDDGSSDYDTLTKVVDGLHDGRFMLLRQANQGGGAARNRGISAARGEWIAFLDSDDKFLPGKLSAMRDAILTHSQVDVLSHYARVIRDSHTQINRPSRPIRIGESVVEFMFAHREFMQTSTLVVRKSLAQFVLFDPKLRKAQDVDFLIRLERAGGKVHFVDGVYSIWNDLPVEGRIGAPRKPDVVLAWYKNQKYFFTSDMQRAFEATYLAYELSKKRPLYAIFLILRARAAGSIGWKTSLIALMRSLLPGAIYRYVVNYAIRSKRRSA